MFVDFETDILFGNELPPMPSPASRGIQSNNRKNSEIYLQARYKYLIDHTFFERLEKIQQHSELQVREIEGLDEDWKKACLHAEKVCKRYPYCPWSQKIADKRQDQKNLRILINSYKLGKDNNLLSTFLDYSRNQINCQ
jgi:hypothetical protein